MDVEFILELCGNRVGTCKTIPTTNFARRMIQRGEILRVEHRERSEVCACRMSAEDNPIRVALELRYSFARPCKYLSDLADLLKDQRFIARSGREFNRIVGNDDNKVF